MLPGQLGKELWLKQTWTYIDSSGPLGGDQQIGSLIVNKDIDLVIFLRDPLTAQAHEPDIHALIRLCDVYSVPIATNLASAEIFIKALDEGELNWRLD